MIPRALSGVFAVSVACAPALYSDPGPFPFEAGAPNALMSGCGTKAAVGYLYCLFPAGWIPTGEIVVMVPPVECGAESCATVTVWSSDLRRVFDKAILRGQTYVVIPWAALLGDRPVETNLRGFLPVLLKWSWIDPLSGVVMQAATEGEIRLRIHLGTYVPLTFDPSAMTWTWRVGGVTFGASDKGRTAIKPDPVR